jgi:RNA polymerase sigma-70 factor (ECF subfamily)
MAQFGTQGVRLGGLEMPASGDAELGRAVAALYRVHFQFVWRSLRRLGVRASSLEDAVQDVFLVTHRKLHAFDGRSSHKAWLFAIAVRVAAEHRRRDARLQLDPDAAAATVHLEKTLELRQQIDLLDRVLDQLLDEQRVVFVMAEIEQFSVPEIATALGVKLNTVYSRLRLARAHFERVLSRQRKAQE